MYDCFSPLQLNFNIHSPSQLSLASTKSVEEVTYDALEGDCNKAIICSDFFTPGPPMISIYSPEYKNGMYDKSTSLFFLV